MLSGLWARTVRSPHISHRTIEGRFPFDRCAAIMNCILDVFGDFFFFHPLDFVLTLLTLLYLCFAPCLSHSLLPLFPDTIFFSFFLPLLLHAHPSPLLSSLFPPTLLFPLRCSPPSDSTTLSCRCRLPECTALPERTPLPLSPFVHRPQRLPTVCHPQLCPGHHPSPFA